MAGASFRLPNPSPFGLAGVPPFVRHVGFRSPFPTHIGMAGFLAPEASPTTGAKPTLFVANVARLMGR